ncbi:MAG TPA: argininosuccinate lyase [Pyrinomonadaceae bacterium]|mgnify:CR=1 FL=1|nr:argininosuccinate lyase [Pyrinomonadaceae bacterium]
MANTQKLWGGRFTGKPEETFARFNRSFGFDIRLFEADVQASIAHAHGLYRAGIFEEKEAMLVAGSLRTLVLLAKEDPDYLILDVEDVHSFIETRLIELVGDLGRKLHTGRSRNDQVATAFRLWLRGEIDRTVLEIRTAQKALVAAAERHLHAVMPGYTHLQRAQPVLWAHWCLAYFEMLERDIERLADVRKRVNVLPLGSAALAGTSFHLDREQVADELGFERVAHNSLDAVSDRDFAVEFAGACSLIMVHLSRLAEDLILYASSEFGFITLSDAVSTGSSLMPQKKNPDALELVRGKAGRVFGHHAGLLAMMKGLPLAYNKDMQEDKEATFDTLETTIQCLKVTSIVLDNLSVNEARMRESATHGFLNATELADYLVRKGMPFRTAHDVTGRIVLMALEHGRELHQVPLEELQKHSPLIGPDVFAALDLDHTVRSKDQIGGTSPFRVMEALRAAKAKSDG